MASADRLGPHCRGAPPPLQRHCDGVPSGNDRLQARPTEPSPRRRTVTTRPAPVPRTEAPDTAAQSEARESSGIGSVMGSVSSAP